MYLSHNINCYIWIDCVHQVVPLAVVVTPLRPLVNLQTLPYEPVTCRSCVCVLNPFCTVDFGTRTWICPFWCVITRLGAVRA